MTSIQARMSLIALSAAALIIGCGKPSEDKNTAPAAAPEISATDAQLANEYANLPEGGVIVRVPVDAEGRENVDAAELRKITTDTEVSEANAEAVFSSGKAPTLAAGELDADSSTQSWHDWRPSQNQGGVGFDDNYTDINISNNQNSNINVTVNNSIYQQSGCNNGWCNGGFFNSYTPRAYSIVNTRSFWGFHRPRCHLFGGFRYYHYRRPVCSGFNWCGTGGGVRPVPYGQAGFGW